MNRLSLQILALFLLSGLVTIPAYAISEKGPRCADGIDNDDDFLIDGDDPDCKPSLVGTWEQVLVNECFGETYQGSRIYGSDGTVQAGGGTIGFQGAWEEGSANTYYETSWAYYPADHPCESCTAKVNQQITLDPDGNAFTGTAQIDLWLGPKFGGIKISETICIGTTGNPWIDIDTTATRITVETPAP